ncbi:MAG: hypothetical protein AB203_00560 [Parcubacteria bacterium C7867-008]|nr:MAG: hypothetical protein AB203_00560 [Parcubacteria bacterium C7867-008]
MVGFVQNLNQGPEIVETAVTAIAIDPIIALLDKFRRCSNFDEYCTELRRLGYTHYIEFQVRRTTIGDMIEEYRVTSAAALFKGVPTPGEMAAAPVVPLLEQRKYYSDMSSIDRGSYVTNLTGAELASWMTFFEAQEKCIHLIEELL